MLIQEHASGIVGGGLATRPKSIGCDPESDDLTCLIFPAKSGKNARPERNWNRSDRRTRPTIEIRHRTHWRFHPRGRVEAAQPFELVDIAASHDHFVGLERGDQAIHNILDTVSPFLLPLAT